MRCLSCTFVCSGKSTSLGVRNPGSYVFSFLESSVIVILKRDNSYKCVANEEVREELISLLWTAIPSGRG